MAETKKKSEFTKEDFDSPVTKEMRKLAGMDDNGNYANKDYDLRDTKFQTNLKSGMRQSDDAKKYINANGKLLNKQARLNLYRKYSPLRNSKNPLIQQKYKDNISRINNKLAKEAVKVHDLQKKAMPGGVPANTNSKEVVDTMSMATGKPNLGLNPTDHAKSGNNVNSDVFKTKFNDKKD